MMQSILTKHWNLQIIYVFPALQHCLGERIARHVGQYWQLNILSDQVAPRYIPQDRNNSALEHPPEKSSFSLRQTWIVNTINCSWTRNKSMQRAQQGLVHLAAQVGFSWLIILILISLQISNMPVTEFRICYTWVLLHPPPVWCIIKRALFAAETNHYILDALILQMSIWTFQHSSITN